MGFHRFATCDPIRHRGITIGGHGVQAIRLAPVFAKPIGQYSVLNQSAFGYAAVNHSDAASQSKSRMVKDREAETHGATCACVSRARSSATYRRCG
jgi:hypothetical protein